MKFNNYLVMKCTPSEMREASLVYKTPAMFINICTKIDFLDSQLIHNLARKPRIIKIHATIYNGENKSTYIYILYFHLLSYDFQFIFFYWGITCHTNGLKQDCSDFIANALDVLQSSVQSSTNRWAYWNVFFLVIFYIFYFIISKYGLPIGLYLVLCIKLLFWEFLHTLKYIISTYLILKWLFRDKV